jgi:hypothetical protein
LAWGLQHNKAATAVIKKSEGRAMSIQKKSLINSRTATQKAIIASTRLVAPVVSNKLFASKAASKAALKVAVKAAGKAGK